MQFAKVARHGLHLREHLNRVQLMVSGGYCEGVFPDTVRWTLLETHGFDRHLVLQPRPPLTRVSQAGIPKESPKSLPGPSGAGVQKVPETVSKQSPESRNSDCFRLFRHFLDPGPEETL